MATNGKINKCNACKNLIFEVLYEHRLQTPIWVNDNVIAIHSTVSQAVTNDCWTSIQQALSTEDLMGLKEKKALPDLVINGLLLYPHINCLEGQCNCTQQKAKETAHLMQFQCSSLH